MKLARLGQDGRETPVVIHENVAYDLTPLTADIDGGFWSSDGLARVRRALSAGELRSLKGADGLRIGSPIARPGAVICLGMNYAAHAAESGTEPPERPVVFLKTPNSVGGPNDPVRIPRGARKVDWEVELGIVIGRETAYLDSREESFARIAGFVLVDDISERHLQLEVSGGQWSKGKVARGFTPAGPWLVPACEVDPSDLRLRSWVNGEPRQDSNTHDLIFDVDTIICDLSQYVTLEPGDLVLTGTPEGVALSGRFSYLGAGDVVELAGDGLGGQRHRLVAWDEQRDAPGSV